MRKRKRVYPPPKTATKSTVPANGPRPPVDRVVSIHPTALLGRSDIGPGARAQVTSGLYAGEVVVVESPVTGLIPAVVVRTADGRSRRVRAVDLVPVSDHLEAGGPERA